MRWKIGSATLVGYVLAAQFGLLLDLPHAVGSPFWPASGIAIAALVLGGWTVLPFLAAGIVLSDLISFSPTITTVGLDLAGALLEPVIAVWLARRLSGGEPPFSFTSSRGVLAAGAGCLVGTAAATALGVAGFSFTVDFDETTIRLSALTWAVGNSAGALLVAPLILILWRGGLSVLAARPVEALVLTLAVPLLSGLFYGDGIVPHVHQHDHAILLMEFLGLPAVLVAAYRFGFAGTALAAFTASTSAILMGCSALGQGSDPLMVNDGLIRLQLYMFVLTLTGHLLAAEMTARSRTDKELRDALLRETEANAAKTVFLARMSHELRTPLNAILGFSEVIHTRALGTGEAAREQYHAYAADIHASGRHLLSLINDILDVSRIESHTYALEKEDLDAETLVRECFAMVRNRVEDVQIRLESRIAPGVPPIHADPRAARQILINLVGNAVKFSPQGGTITVRAEGTECGGVRVVVADHGIGIPAHARTTLFEPFRRAHSHLHSHQFEGTGLGLAICKGLMDLHGGTIAIDSEPGQGTMVTLDFPPRLPLPAPEGDRARDQPEIACQTRTA